MYNVYTYNRKDLIILWKGLNLTLKFGFAIEFRFSEKCEMLHNILKLAL